MVMHIWSHYKQRDKIVLSNEQWETGGAETEAETV